jgi:hypothetical protein
LSTFNGQNRELEAIKQRLMGVSQTSPRVDIGGFDVFDKTAEDDTMFEHPLASSMLAAKQSSEP